MAAYLYFDEFFDAIGDENVFVAIGRFADQSLVTSLEPAAVGEVDECLGVGLFVVEIAEDDGRGLHNELASLVVFGHFVALRVDDACLESRQERSRGAGEQIVLARGVDHGRRLRHAYFAKVLSAKQFSFFLSFFLFS